MSAICGIDWASEWHDVRIADAHDGSVLVERRFAHDETGLAGLIDVLVEHRVERVAIERPDGLLVGRLLAAGICVLAIHPNQVAAARDRFRAAAGKSDRLTRWCSASSPAPISTALRCSPRAATRRSRCAH